MRANGMCRHRVMLVLSYQRLCATTQSTEKRRRVIRSGWKNWLPLPDATPQRAQALVAKGITIELFCTPGEIPSARLPMSDVRFIPVAAFVSPVVIVLKAHFANMSYWQYRPLSGKSAASGIDSFNLADAQRTRHIT